MRYRNKQQQYNTDAIELSPTWKALFEENLCSRWRKIEMQQKLDEEEERLRAAEDEVLEQKEKLANAARKAEKEKKLSKNMMNFQKTQGQSYFFHRC